MCDGMWSKRGFTASNGVVVIISWESRQVLDYEILSKRCNVCQRQKTIWGEGSVRYLGGGFSEIFGGRVQ